MPADGFYEWKKEGKAKQSYLIGLKGGRLFAFAGLWESWTVREGTELAGKLSEFRPGDQIETFTILTTEANDFLARIHNRMPVILVADEFDAWLTGEVVPLDPYPSDKMAAYPVSTLVNSPKNDDAACVEPLGDLR